MPQEHVIELIPIDSIQVSGERVRKDFRNEMELVASIRAHGLLHPLVVDDTGVLIAGERRLRALQRLKWTEAPCVRISNLSEREKLEIELEENTRREDLTWQEQVLAEKRLLELRGQGVVEFAEENGLAAGKVSQDLQLAQALERDPGSPLWQEEKKSKALNKMKTDHQLKVFEALQQLVGPQDTGDSKSGPSVELLLGDSREVLGTLPERPWACLVTDPPWGVNFGDASWDDSKKGAFSLMEEVLGKCYELLLPDSHAYVRFGMAVYTEALHLLRSIGWKVSPLPIVELLPGNRTGLGRLVTWNNCYSVWFFCWKGQRKLAPPCNNVVPATNEGRVSWHPSPVAPATVEAFLRASTQPGEWVLDPFAGSASVLRAAKACGRNAVGIEVNELYYRLAQKEMKGGDSK